MALATLIIVSLILVIRIIVLVVRINRDKEGHGYRELKNKKS